MIIRRLWTISAFAIAAGLATPLVAASPDPAAVQARLLPFDVHLDIDTTFDSTGQPAGADGTTQFDLVKAKRGGIKAVALAIFVPQAQESPEQLAAVRQTAERKLHIIAGLATRYPKQVGIAHSPAELRSIAASGRLAVVESIVNGGAFIDSLADLDRWQRDGVRIFGFVHAGHNRLADSSRPAAPRGEGTSRNDGLSSLGRQAVGRLNDLGVLIDVSQLSDAAFDDVLRLTRVPVIASHSDVRALVPAGRNLTDPQLLALKASGGVIALNAFSAYLHPPSEATKAALAALQSEFGIKDGSTASLSADREADYARRSHEIQAQEPKATVADLADALDHAVKLIGIDHVALSSDFNHGGGVVGWGDESEAANVTAELLRRGYSEADLAKIWSGNVLRIWGQAQAGASTAAHEGH